MTKIPVTDDAAEKRSTSASPTRVASGGSTSPVENAPTEQGDGDDPMAGLQADLDRFRDLAARSQADFENYKKRCAREKEEGIKYANAALLEKLVPIVDNFE